MIPKIIHFCWLSNDPYPQIIDKCIKSWEKNLNGYELRLWNFDRFPRGKSKWVDDAFDNRKFAFAADYIRAYALFHEGGIYLDSDVEVLKNFDEFLHLPYFFGQESDSGKIEAAVMGAEKGFQLFGDMLDYYDSRSFIKGDGTFDTKPMPSILNEKVSKYGERTGINKISQFNNDPDKFYVFTPDYFSPIHIVNLQLEKTENTVSIHHFAGSWNPRSKRLRKTIQRIIGPKPTLLIQKIKHWIVG